MSIWTRIADALSALANGEGLAAVMDRLRASPTPERSVAFTIDSSWKRARMAPSKTTLAIATIVMPW